jgi:hypothetical protein
MGVRAIEQITAWDLFIMRLALLGCVGGCEIYFRIRFDDDGLEVAAFVVLVQKRFVFSILKV